MSDVHIFVLLSDYYSRHVNRVTNEQYTNNNKSGDKAEFVSYLIKIKKFSITKMYEYNINNRMINNLVFDSDLVKICTMTKLCIVLFS